MEIIGYRKRNGRVERSFTAIKRETLKKNLEDERKEFLENNTDCDGVDFAYQQKVSDRVLEKELGELGLTIKDVAEARERWNQKKANEKKAN
jgi:hypothetical protein